jgi:hypothetical protein
MSNCKLEWLIFGIVGVRFNQILTLKKLSHEYHPLTITFEKPKFIFSNQYKIVKFHLHYIERNEITRLQQLLKLIF